VTQTQLTAAGATSEIAFKVNLQATGELRGDAQAGLNGVSAKIATGFAIFGSTGVDLAEVTRTGSGVFADVFINVIRRIQARITVDVDGGVFSLEFNRRGGVGHAHHECPGQYCDRDGELVLCHRLCLFCVVFAVFQGAGSGKGIPVAQSHLGRQAINDKLFAQLSNLNK
jgi:hypothetical protein